MPIGTETSPGLLPEASSLRPGGTSLSFLTSDQPPTQCTSQENLIPQVLLERELAKLSAELDKDLRAIETRLPSPKVPASRELQEKGFRLSSRGHREAGKPRNWRPWADFSLVPSFKTLGVNFLSDP